MVRTSNARVVLVTCGSLAEARKIAKAVVGQSLAACVNVISVPVESMYRWEKKVERAREFLMIIKTTKRRLTQLELEITRLHSYEVPEFLVIEVAGGSKKYLKWLIDSA